MDESDDQTSGGVRLNAAEANQLAQELNDRARGAASSGLDRDPQVTPEVSSRPVTQSESTDSSDESSLEAAKSGVKPLESEEAGESEHVFPPDIDPTITVGGSAEEQGALREEYRHG